MRCVSSSPRHINNAQLAVHQRAAEDHRAEQMTGAAFSNRFDCSEFHS